MLKAVLLGVLACVQAAIATNVDEAGTKEKARLALEYVDNVAKTAGSCAGGTGTVLPIDFNHTTWKSQALVAVHTANWITKLWMWYNGTPPAIDDFYFYAMTRSMVEIESSIFGAAIGFDEYAYKDYRMVGFYSYTAQNKTNSHDLAVNYNYLDQLDSEWFHVPREKVYDERLRVVNQKRRYNKTGNAHIGLEEFFEPYVNLDDGHWTKPYFDCGGGDIWMVTYSSPMFAPAPNNSSLTTFSGVATVDIDLSNIDINQCDPESNESWGTTDDVFRGTHLCLPTTRCVPRRSLGFRSGAYYCMCQDGYYFPNTSRSPPGYLGIDVEREFALMNENKYNVYKAFVCNPCSEGCDICIDSSPCIATSNVPFRVTLLIVVIGDVMLAISIIIFVYFHRAKPIIKAASPLFCYLIAIGALLMCGDVILLFFKPSDALCMTAPWFHHFGFFLMYGSLLLRTWRVSQIFKVKSAKQLKLGDKDLGKRLIPICTVAVGYLFAWTLGSPSYAITIKNQDDLKIYYCSHDWWQYAATLGQCTFLLWGVYLCYSVRKAPSSFNESKFISWAIYNTIFMNNFIVIIRVVILGSVGPDLLYMLHVIQLQVPATITLLLIFAPKVYMIHSAEEPSNAPGASVTGYRSNRVAPAPPAVASVSGGLALPPPPS